MVGNTKLRLVRALPKTVLRDTLVASYRSARMAVRDGTLRLNAASRAGQLLVEQDDIARALLVCEGSDDFAVRVRGHLHAVLEEESRPS